MADRTLVPSTQTRDWLEANRPELALRLYRYLLTAHFQAG